MLLCKFNELILDTTVPKSVWNDQAYGFQVAEIKKCLKISFSKVVRDAQVVKNTSVSVSPQYRGLFSFCFKKIMPQRFSTSEYTHLPSQRVRFPQGLIKVTFTVISLLHRAKSVIS